MPLFYYRLTGFCPHKPRRRWLRALCALAGIVLMLPLLALGLLIGVGMLVVRALRRPAPAANRPADVLEGNFRVVSSGSQRLSAR
jgi:hypothetical protein